MSQLAEKLSCSEEQTNSDGSVNSNNECIKPITLEKLVDVWPTVKIFNLKRIKR
jgi:hypothetical protein